MPMASDRCGVLSTSAFQRLLDALGVKGYRIVGPVVRDGAVVWDTVERTADLPIGWRDAQEPGRYRLERSVDERLFGVVHGPQSLKPFSFAPREPLLTIERSKNSLTAVPTMPKSEKVAVLGARPCDVAGLAMQDRIFLRDAYADPYYQARRNGMFVVSVNCTRALSTCFCASMGSGPQAKDGFDLALTELDEVFLVEAGSQEGREILSALAIDPASPAQIEKAESTIGSCAMSQTRRLDTAQLPQALYEAHEHPRWEEVAARCLACGNCTMVCPTCFCHAVEETPDVTRQRSEHARQWDSCFTQEHGYIHGKNIRPAVKDRYRMWLTHKLASWIDQFGTSGCVGCGRCITWCPVGIDLTVELATLLASAGGREPSASMKEGRSE
jgi:sulfhydrogenase subunit beta (sulfur reductase)